MLSLSFSDLYTRKNVLTPSLPTYGLNSAITVLLQNSFGIKQATKVDIPLNEKKTTYKHQKGKNLFLSKLEYSIYLKMFLKLRFLTIVT